MDQGMIRALKAKHCSLAVRKLILALEKKEPIPKFSILSAMYMLKKAWDAISNQTFTNCFRKLGISEKDAVKTMNDEEDPFKGLEDNDVEEDPVQALNADLSILKERDLLIKLMLTSHLTNMSISTSKLAHHTVNEQMLK